jgi:2-dehydropantoate 2-reductase
MYIVLVGPGALGSLFAVRLSPYLQEEGNALSLLDHNAQRARLLTANGFTLQHGNDEFSSFPPVLSDPGNIPACDVLLLCVKAGDVKKALLDTAPLITTNTLVVGIQNGMAHLEVLQKTTGIPIIATSSEGAALQAPGRVIYGGAGLTRFGLPGDSASIPVNLKKLVALFNRAGLQAELVPDIQAYLWEKLVINVGINALTAIYGQKNGWLLTDDKVMTVMKMAIAEAVSIAEKKKIPFHNNPLAQTFEVCRKTENNVSSMLQDVQKKRRTEIDAINGYIVREGEKLGIMTPINADLVRQVREIESCW